MIGEFGARIYDLEIEITDDFESGTLSVKLPTKKIIAEVIDGDPIFKDIILDDVCRVELATSQYLHQNSKFMKNGKWMKTKETKADGRRPS